MSAAGFWDRRRAAVAAEQEQAHTAKVEAEVADRTDAEILAELDLPAPEEVTDPDQIRKFLTKAVPQRIKTRALRQLWGLNPVLANLDGLIDYGEDFTDKATVIENMQTAYQVGKGMLSHIEALAAEKDAPQPPEPPAQDDDDDEELPEYIAAAEPTDQTDAPDQEELSFVRRRMTFAFDAPQKGAT